MLDQKCACKLHGYQHLLMLPLLVFVSLLCAKVRTTLSYDVIVAELAILSQL